MFKHLSRIILKTRGWKVVGEFPSLNKYVIIMAPHTSNWDFIISLLVRSATDLKSRFLAKDSLFKPPVGWLFKKLGGYPVDRSKSKRLVDKVIDIYNKEDLFIVTIAPEGTRKKVKDWKSGFYYIAHGANVPIVMAAIDYGTKEVKISEPFYPTGDYEKDLLEIKSFYKGVKGKKDL